MKFTLNGVHFNVESVIKKDIDSFVASNRHTVFKIGGKRIDESKTDALLRQVYSRCTDLAKKQGLKGYNNDITVIHPVIQKNKVTKQQQVKQEN